MRVICRVAAALAAAGFAAVATAQPFPGRTVTLTVGFAPGGGTDTAARIVAQKLSENIGQSVVVENKTGAGGNIAAQQIALAPPDGYTIHLTSVGPMSVAPHLVKNLGYDPKRDIAPITMGVVFPNVFVVADGVPAKTLADFVTLAKQTPGKFTYGSSGIGGAGHLAGELFKERAGIDMVHAPYKGGGPAMTDLLGGRIEMYVGVPSTAQPHIDAGKIRALATTGTRARRDAAQRSDRRRVGLSGLRGHQLVRVRRPGEDAEGDPRLLEPRDREGAADPRVKDELARHGLDPVPGTRDDLAQYIDRETVKWGKVVREAKITAE